MICSVADRNDPALRILEDVRHAHPLAPFRVVIGGDPALKRGNRKVARLIAAERVARGEILVISDSNAWTEADDLAQTLRAFDDPTVGCVSNLFTGQGARSLGARIESLHLLTFVVPGNVIAAFGKVPCVVGKSMAITREALQAIGGFRAFSRVLAEDQAIGIAMRDADYRIVLSPVVVRNVVVQRTVARALARQIRWNKIRYAMSKPCYAAELLLFPLPLAILAAFAGSLAGSPEAILLPIVAWVLRLAQVALLARATGARMDLLLVALQDLLQWVVQFAPLFDDTVTWRGCSARIGPKTVLLQITARAA